MPRLVRGRFGDVLRVAIAQIVVEDVADVWGAVVKPSDVGHSTCRSSIPIVRTASDRDVGDDAVRQTAGRNRGDIDVERRIVLGDAPPNLVDRTEFAFAKGGWIAVPVVGRRRDVRPTSPTGLNVAVKIEE